mmetsp:Transcript_16705/g.24485  ORF Transcript_16705/g.24485 Transcript_16705/m.24485 type:complete len:200 (-) Transcript_16705:68-667(-)
MPSSHFFASSLVLCLLLSSINAFTTPSPTSLGTTTATAGVKQSVTSLNIFNKGRSSSASSSLLPKPDPENSERFIAPQAYDKKELFPIYMSLLRNGPVPFLKRLTSSDSYEQEIFKYQFDQKETDLEEAQANTDAFIASPDVYLENKLKESKGEREVYKYATPMPQDRVVLSIAWGLTSSGLITWAVGKIVYKTFLVNL